MRLQLYTIEWVIISTGVSVSENGEEERNGL
jgi:hypothetical protein